LDETTSRDTQVRSQLVTTRREFETIAYANDGGDALEIDVFAPDTKGRHCAVLIFHGGGWRFGSRELVHPRARALAAQGFTALAVQYRLLDAAPWPAPLTDASAALRWTRANSERLDINPRNVVVQGHSAGGHIALMTGTLEPDLRPAAIATYYPAIGFYPAVEPAEDLRAGMPPTVPDIVPDELGRVPSWLLFPPNTCIADLVAASPIELVNPKFPPTIFFHGTADRVHDVKGSSSLHCRLLELGVPSDLHVYAGRQHDFDIAPSMLPVTTSALTYFVERVHLEREAMEEEARQFGFPPPA
jgi:acetyl esterase/lipase